jgi:hypothetical protein
MEIFNYGCLVTATQETVITDDDEDNRQDTEGDPKPRDRKANRLVYEWNTRCHLLDILEGPATARAQERGPDCLETRRIGASVTLVLKKRINMDWYTVTALTSSRNRSRRTVLRREQREQLDNHNREDWTTHVEKK